MKSYDYRHTVGFEDTNLVGNVYYVNYLRWQGRCREMFLRDHAPAVLAEIQGGLCLVTTRVECEMYEEVAPFDVVTIRMRLEEAGPARIAMEFEYLVGSGTDERPVARGRQEVRCARRGGHGMVGCVVPDGLQRALLMFAH